MDNQIAPKTENKIDNNMEKQCPLCLDTMIYFTPRYPQMICQKCSNGDNGTIVDSSGNKVSFYNADIYGGFISIHIINNEKVTKEDHVCFINNIKCFATDARFGGIVIQKMD